MFFSTEFMKTKPSNVQGVELFDEFETVNGTTLKQHSGAGLESVDPRSRGRSIRPRQKVMPVRLRRFVTRFCKC